MKWWRRSANSNAPWRKNVRIVVWVGRMFGESFLLINIHHVCNSWNQIREDGSSTRHMAYTKYLFSEFLTPSRRSHPHVEPLLATYEFLASKQVAKYFSEPSRDTFPMKISHPWSHHFCFHPKSLTDCKKLCLERPSFAPCISAKFPILTLFPIFESSPFNPKKPVRSLYY